MKICSKFKEHLCRRAILINLRSQSAPEKKDFSPQKQSFVIFPYLFMRQEATMTCLWHDYDKASMPRSYWMMEYHQCWFEKMLENEGSELLKDFWKEEFRVLSTIFNYIIDLIRDKMRWTSKKCLLGLWNFQSQELKQQLKSSNLKNLLIVKYSIAGKYIQIYWR